MRYQRFLKSAAGLSSLMWAQTKPDLAISDKYLCSNFTVHIGNRPVLCYKKKNNNAYVFLFKK